MCDRLKSNDNNSYRKLDKYRIRSFKTLHICMSQKGKMLMKIKAGGEESDLELVGGGTKWGLRNS